MLLVDSHCHLDFPQLAADEAGVVGRAEAAGVGVMQTICTRLTQAENVLALAARHPGVVCAMGVHPHNAGEEGLEEPGPLLELAERAKVVGIGESGLDYHYDMSPREVQKRSFRAHIAAARETGLPLIVHTREADEDTAAILREEMGRGPFSGVIHCYSSSPALADAAVELGLYLGIGGILTFKRSDELRATVSRLPLDNLLLETDAPYLAPVPRRGKTNEPSYIPYIAETLASVKGEPLATIAEATTANFFRLFARAVRPAGP